MTSADASRQMMVGFQHGMCRNPTIIC